MADLIAMRRMNRAQNLALLARRGFSPAEWLPLREHRGVLRPTIELAHRAMAVAALYAWAAGDEPSGALRAHIDRNQLENALSHDERSLLGLDREEARRDYQGEEHLDQLWALTWILGNDPAPDFEGRSLSAEASRAILGFALRGLDASCEGFAARARLRSIAEVAVVDDLFYCVHNAAVRALFGEPTAGPGFDALSAEARIRARRRAVVWSLAPEWSWNEVELDT